MYFDLNEENDKEGPQFKFGDHVKINKLNNLLTTKQGK